MGRGEVISGGTGGQYTVKLLLHRDRVTSELASLATKISVIESHIADLESADVPDAVLISAKKLLKLSYEKRTQYLNDNIEDDPTVEAWCADLTTDLAGEVGTIEVPGERAGVPVVIQPGHLGAAAYNTTRDGQLQPCLGGTPSSVFYNLAMMPGWQKWKPTYRLGEIIAKDGDTCSVAIDPATFSDRGSGLSPNLNVNQDTDAGLVTLEDVPIAYMTCNGIAFQVGDRVIVKFTDQDWIQPVVIGFEDNPQPCNPFIAISVSGYTINLSSQKQVTTEKMFLYWDIGENKPADIPKTGGGLWEYPISWVDYNTGTFQDDMVAAGLDGSTTVPQLIENLGRVNSPFRRTNNFYNWLITGTDKQDLHAGYAVGPRIGTTAGNQLYDLTPAATGEFTYGSGQRGFDSDDDFNGGLFQWDTADQYPVSDDYKSCWLANYSGMGSFVARTHCQGIHASVGADDSASDSYSEALPNSFGNNDSVESSINQVLNWSWVPTLSYSAGIDTPVYPYLAEWSGSQDFSYLAEWNHTINLPDGGFFMPLGSLYPSPGTWGGAESRVGTATNLEPFIQTYDNVLGVLNSSNADVYADAVQMLWQGVGSCTQSFNHSASDSLYNPSGGDSWVWTQTSYAFTSLWDKRYTGNGTCTLPSLDPTDLRVKTCQFVEYETGTLSFADRSEPTKFIKWLDDYENSMGGQYFNRVTDYGSGYRASDLNDFQIVILSESVSTGTKTITASIPPGSGGVEWSYPQEETYPAYSDMIREYRADAICSLCADAETQNPWALNHNPELSAAINNMLDSWVALYPTPSVYPAGSWNLQGFLEYKDMDFWRFSFVIKTVAG